MRQIRRGGLPHLTLSRLIWRGVLSRSCRLRQAAGRTPDRAMSFGSPIPVPDGAATLGPMCGGELNDGDDRILGGELVVTLVGAHGLMQVRNGSFSKPSLRSWTWESFVS